MNLDRYERKIADLERYLEAAQTELRHVKDSQESRMIEALGNREVLYKDLMVFFQDLYSRLGKIQYELLDHMGTIGKQLTQTNEAKVSTMVKELRKAIGIDAPKKLFEDD